MNRHIICTSQYLRTDKETQQVAAELYSAFDRLGIEHQELTNTNDYWCRDYMPVLLYEGAYSKYKYHPDYLWDYKTKRRYITEQSDACEGLDLYTPTNMGIIFDGGNYVRCGDKVIMTDKIFSENHDCPNDVEAIRMMTRLFPDKEIVPIYAMPLIKRGGALHCVTWEYVPNQIKWVPTTYNRYEVDEFRLYGHKGGYRQCLQLWH